MPETPSPGLSSFALSSQIVKRALEQSIITKALNAYMPKQLVHQSCTHNAQEIQQSLINIEQSKPDCSPARIGNGVDGDSSPISFVLRKKSIPVKFVERTHAVKPSIARISRGSFNISQSKQGRILSEANLFSLDRMGSQQLKELRSLNSFARLYPSSSTHQFENRADNPKSVCFQKLPQSQQEPTERDHQDPINQFRQNLIFKPYYSQNVQKMLTSKKSDARDWKKIKDSQPKKCMALTTDYSGHWVHINKNDLKREIVHYVEVQAEVVDDSNEVQTVGNVPRIPLEIELPAEHANFKELKTVKNDTHFTNKILNKLRNDFKSKQEISHEEQHQDGQNNQNHQFQEIKLTGKTCKPQRVGFHIFERMKKSNCKISKENQQTKPEKQSQVQEVRKKWSFRPKQSIRQNKIDSLRQNFVQRSLKKSSAIQLGSWNAVNYLLKQDQKPYKKKVTINEHFI